MHRSVRFALVLAAALACVIGLVPGAVAATPRQRLANVVVPAYCTMPRQRLHDGNTAAKYQPAMGWMTLSGAAAPIRVHLRHGTQLLAEYDCTAGGVSWPSVLVLYSRTNRLIAFLKLERYSNTEHSNVVRWKVLSGHRVLVRWASYNGCCFDLHHHRSILVLRHGKLRFA